MPQLRKIEKFGLIRFDEEERQSLFLWVVARVLQRQNNEYISTKYQRPQGFYGTYQKMYNNYVVESGTIQYYNQLVHWHHRDADQAAEVLSCHNMHHRNFYSDISLRVNVPLPFIFVEDGEVKQVAPIIDAILFKLADGCVLEVESGGLGFFRCVLEDAGDEEVPPPPPPPIGDPPVFAPPLGAPPTTSPPGQGGLFEISPPYDEGDDDGDTYIPPFLPPWDGDDGQDEQARYTVLVREQLRNPDDSQQGPDRNILKINVPGKIQGLGTNDPGNASGAYGIKSNGSVSTEGYLGQNYEFKIAWPYPNFTNYRISKIIQVTKQ